MKESLSGVGNRPDLIYPEASPLEQVALAGPEMVRETMIDAVHQAAGKHIVDYCSHLQPDQPPTPPPLDCHFPKQPGHHGRAFVDFPDVFKHGSPLSELIEANIGEAHRLRQLLAREEPEARRSRGKISSRPNQPIWDSRSQIRATHGSLQFLDRVTRKHEGQQRRLYEIYRMLGSFMSVCVFYPPRSDFRPPKMKQPKPSLQTHPHEEDKRSTRTQTVRFRRSPTGKLIADAFLVAAGLALASCGPPQTNTLSPTSQPSSSSSVPTEQPPKGVCVCRQQWSLFPYYNPGSSITIGDITATCEDYNDPSTPPFWQAYDASRGDKPYVHAPGNDCPPKDPSLWKGGIPKAPPTKAASATPKAVRTPLPEPTATSIPPTPNHTIRSTGLDGGNLGLYQCPSASLFDRTLYRQPERPVFQVKKGPDGKYTLNGKASGKDQDDTLGAELCYQGTDGLGWNQCQPFPLSINGDSFQAIVPQTIIESMTGKGHLKIYVKYTVNPSIQCQDGSSVTFEAVGFSDLP